MLDQLKDLAAATFRAWASQLQPPNGSSTSTTPTPSTPTTPAGEDRLLSLVQTMMTTMASTQETSARETRELVLSILQGRPQEGTPEVRDPVVDELSRLNYDDDSIPLAPGIEAVLDREQREEDELRALRTEREALAEQLARAQAVLTDPQGPSASASY